MKKINFYILSLIAILILSCKSELKKKDFDKLLTTEFLNQVIKNEDFIKTDCVLEISTWKLPKFENDFEKYLQETLKIKDTSHLNLQTKLCKDFIITNEIAFGKNILKNEDYISLNQTFKNSEFDYLDWLELQKCKRGFNSISKPLFNETYDYAIIYIENICGPLCGGNWIIAYELKDKKWIQKEVLNATVK